MSTIVTPTAAAEAPFWVFVDVVITRTHPESRSRSQWHRLLAGKEPVTLPSLLSAPLPNPGLEFSMTPLQRDQLPCIYGILLGVVMAVLIGGAVFPGIVTSQFLRSQPTQVDPLSTIELEARPEIRVPIVQPGGIIDTIFPDGVPMGTSGIDQAMALVKETAQATGIDQQLVDRLIVPYQHSPNAPSKPAYPYSYPTYDGLTAQISDDEIREYRDELVEFSSALLYAQRAPAAYSLLNRMRQVENSCAIQVNLAQTVALGFAPDISNVEQEFEHAIDLCEDTPIALVAYAQARLGFDTRGWLPGQDRVGYHLGTLGEESRALELAREAEQRFPTDPAGYATEAAILLEVADKFADESMYPFAVRSMYQRALTLLDAVVMVETADPSVSFGQARALAGLQRPEEAAELASALAPTFANEVERNHALEAAAFMQFDLGNAEQALELVDMIPGDWTRPLVSVKECRSLVPVGNNSFRGIMGAPEPGWLGNCHTAMADATGNQFPSGADSLDFIDYIPQYREKYISRQNLLVLAGRHEEARAQEKGSGFQAMLDGRWYEFSRGSSGRIEAVQDAYRRLGRYEEAQELLQAALDAQVGDPALLRNRMGEVLYLQQQYEAAASEFEAASRLQLGEAAEEARAHYAEFGIGPEWSSIKQAAALYQGGSLGEAYAVLNGLTITQPDVIFPRARFPEWNYAATQVAPLTLTGTIELEMEDYDAAVITLQEAVDICGPWLGRDVDICQSGVQFNNLAVALLKSGRPGEAAEAAREAIRCDPDNPMFVEALANAFEAAGDTENAIVGYRETVSKDLTQVTAHNNLGVLLARQGEFVEATAEFVAAVQEQPEYAPGWFNLGVAYSEGSNLRGFLLSQGAFARASHLNSEFRDAAPEWYADENVYDPGLDLSKPLPADWTAGSARHRIPPNFTVLVVAFISLLVSVVISDSVKNRLTESALERATSSKKLLWSSRAALWIDALVLTAVATITMIRTLGFGTWVVVTGGLLGLALSGVFLFSRQVLDARLQHSMHAGAAAVGLLGVPIGIPFVPVPVLAEETSAGVRLRPYLVLGGFALVALVLAWWSRVPLVRSTLDVIVLMLASGAIAVAPFDGNKFHRVPALVAAGFIGVVGLLLGLRLL